MGKNLKITNIHETEVIVVQQNVAIINYQPVKPSETNENDINTLKNNINRMIMLSAAGIFLFFPLYYANNVYKQIKDKMPDEDSKKKLLFMLILPFFWFLYFIPLIIAIVLRNKLFATLTQYKDESEATFSETDAYKWKQIAISNDPHLVKIVMLHETNNRPYPLEQYNLSFDRLFYCNKPMHFHKMLIDEGWLEKSSSGYSISDKGRKFLDEYDDIYELYKRNKAYLPYYYEDYMRSRKHGKNQYLELFVPLQNKKIKYELSKEKYSEAAKSIILLALLIEEKTNQPDYSLIALFCYLRLSGIKNGNTVCEFKKLFTTHQIKQLHKAIQGKDLQQIQDGLDHIDQSVSVPFSYFTPEQMKSILASIYNNEKPDIDQLYQIAQKPVSTAVSYTYNQK